MGRVLALSLYPSIGRRHHEIAVLGVGCQYAVVTGEIGPGSGYESRQLSQKLQRFEDEMCGAVLEGVCLRRRSRQSCAGSAGVG